jgi:hypothetical protein
LLLLVFNCCRKYTAAHKRKTSNGPKGKGGDVIKQAKLAETGSDGFRAAMVSLETVRRGLDPPFDAGLFENPADIDPLLRTKQGVKQRRGVW